MHSDNGQSKLAKFREQLYAEDILHDGDTIGTDDETLLRFLRARKFDLQESTRMFKNCQHWRKTVAGVGIDELYKKTDPFDYPERTEVFKSWSMYFHKTDKKGRPLNIEHFGGLNLPELYKHVTPDRHWETIVVCAECLPREVLPAAAEAAGQNISQVFVIVDLKGFSLSQFWQVRSLAQRSFQISQNYFPETMGQLAIINAPTSFTYIWSFIKPWLAKETVEKIDILGSNYLEVLLELIDEENLPEVLGGKCRCDGLGGCGFSSAGPWLDRRRRLAESGQTTKDGQPMKTETDVPSGEEGSERETSPSDSTGMSATTPDTLVSEPGVAQGNGHLEKVADRATGVEFDEVFT